MMVYFQIFPRKGNTARLRKEERERTRPLLALALQDWAFRAVGHAPRFRGGSGLSKEGAGLWRPEGAGLSGERRANWLEILRRRWGRLARAQKGSLGPGVAFLGSS